MRWFQLSPLITAYWASSHAHSTNFDEHERAPGLLQNIPVGFFRVFWVHRHTPESLLNVSLITSGGSRNCFAYRDHRHNHAHHRNDRSDRSKTRPLCSISRPKSNVDAYGIDRHGGGPLGERTWRRLVQALDRHRACELARAPSSSRLIRNRKYPGPTKLGRIRGEP
jgi:hypothetical protein